MNVAVHEKVSAKFNAQRNTNFVHNKDTGKILKENVLIDFNTSTFYLEIPEYDLCYAKVLPDLPIKNLSDYMDHLADPKSGLAHYRGQTTLKNLPDEKFFQYDYAVKDLPAPDNATKQCFFDTESGQLIWEHDTGRLIDVYVPKGLKDETNNFSAADFAVPESCKDPLALPDHKLQAMKENSIFTHHFGVWF